MTDRTRLSRSWKLTIVLLITLVAGILRFYRLQEVPPGLHFDKGFKGVTTRALLCALGAWTLWRGAARVDRQWPRVAVALLLTVGLVFSGVSTARAYYLTWGQSPDLFYAYDVGLVEIAEYINILPADQDVYLTPTFRDHFSLAYLAHRPFESFDGRAGLVFAPPERDATVIVLLREDSATLPALKQMRPDGNVTWTLTDSFGRPYAAAYHLPALAGELAPFPPPNHRMEATFSGKARFLGYSLDAETVAPGSSLNLILYWQALAPLDDDYTVFAHLLGSPKPSTGSPIWAGHDAQPDLGHYPTTDAEGQPIPDDAVLLGPIQVED